MTKSLNVFLFSIGTLFHIQISALDTYIYPYNDIASYSNYGTIGLIQVPSARMLSEGNLALSWTSNSPYKRGSVVAYPFSWLEVSYQYTDIDNALYSDVPLFSGSQTFKDKSFSTKVRLLSENFYRPEVSLGFRDLAGTGIFASEYLVATKRISNFDISMGIGWGNLASNRYSNPLKNISSRFDKRTVDFDSKGGEFNLGYFFSGDIGIFGGIEYFIPNFHGARIKLEYDSTDYKKEGFPFGRDSFSLAFKPIKQPSTRFNVGFHFHLSDLVDIKLGFVKGNTFSLGFSVKMPLANKDPLLAKTERYTETENKEIIKKINTERPDLIYRSYQKYLQEKEFYLQRASIKESELRIVYTQSKYNSFMQATGRIARTLDEISPDSINSFKISNINGGIGMHTISINREEFNKYKEENLFTNLERVSQISEFTYSEEDYLYRPRSKYPLTFWNISPAIRSQIGGPDGFFFGDIRLNFKSETLLRKNLSFMLSASTGIYDNFDELKLKSDSILPHVRTDIVSYLKESRSFALGRAQLNYFKQVNANTYLKLSGGILEEMFGGIGGEILYRPFSKDFGLGAEYWNVKQREYSQRLSFRDYQTETGHLNFYYLFPNNVLFKIKGGRFLAKDSGFNFDFSKRFRSGFRVGAFFSLTDISREEFGEGSFDKGFYFFIPIDSFFQNYERGYTGFGLRPITRDGAAIINHGFHLWGVTDQAQKNTLSRDWDDIYN